MPCIVCCRNCSCWSFVRLSSVRKSCPFSCFRSSTSFLYASSCHRRLSFSSFSAYAWAARAKRKWKCEKRSVKWIVSFQITQRTLSGEMTIQLNASETLQSWDKTQQSWTWLGSGKDCSGRLFPGMEEAIKWPWIIQMILAIWLLNLGLYFRKKLACSPRARHSPTLQHFPSDVIGTDTAI